MQEEQDYIIPLTIESGINRDGTKFSHKYCVAGQWVRFYYGKPRKIGGYRMLYPNIQNIVRGGTVISKNGYNNYWFGTSNNLYKLPIDNFGGVSALVDATPAAFVTSANNVWQFDEMFDTDSTALVVFAHAGQNITDIDSAVETAVWYGDASLNTALVTTGESVSGGVCCLHPYVFIYGNNGLVKWAAPGTVNFSGTGADEARITGSKIIKGVSIKGGTNSPSGLFWSLDTLHRMYFVGGATIFANEMIGQTRLLSSSAVVEYDGLYYWPCTDRRFSYWNGYIRDLPNPMNQDFFFNNLNWAYRQKVHGVKVSQYNEIWWFYPSGTSTECDHVIIYNVKDNTFYDTALSRSTAVASEVFPYPVMFGNTVDSFNGYAIWQHEYGYDEIINATVNAIPSYFEGPNITFIDQAPNNDYWVYIDWFEPDFVQTGDMTLEIVGEDYPQQAISDTSQPFTISEDSAKIDLQIQRRIMRIRVTSNTAGGFYYMGRPLMNIRHGVGRQFSVSSS